MGSVLMLVWHSLYTLSQLPNPQWHIQKCTVPSAALTSHVINLQWLSNHIWLPSASWEVQEVTFVGMDKSSDPVISFPYRTKVNGKRGEANAVGEISGQSKIFLVPERQPI